MTDAPTSGSRWFKRNQPADTKPNPPQANGHALNGNGSGSVTSLDIKSLQRELAATHERLKLLAQDREQLALPSLQGDIEANHRIGEIDAERQSLALRQETLQAAIKQLNHQIRQNKADKWKARLPEGVYLARREAANNAEVRAERLVADLRTPHLNEARRTLEEIEALEMEAAKYAADIIAPPVGIVRGPDSAPNFAEIRDLHEAHLTEVANAILAHPEYKRPELLVGLIDYAKERVAELRREAQQREKREKEEWDREGARKTR